MKSVDLLQGGISQQHRLVLFFKQYSCQTGRVKTQRATIRSTLLSRAGLIHYRHWKKYQSNLITNGADYLWDYSEHVQWRKWHSDCERLGANIIAPILKQLPPDKANEVAA